VQDRSKTNVFVFDCEEEEIRKKRSFVLLWNKAKKNEYNRSSTIKNLPLLLLTLTPKLASSSSLPHGQQHPLLSLLGERGQLLSHCPPSHKSNWHPFEFMQSIWHADRPCSPTEPESVPFPVSPSPATGRLSSSS